VSNGDPVTEATLTTGELGLKVGVEFERGKIFYGAGYTHGLTNYLEADETTDPRVDSIKTRTLSVIVGWIFKKANSPLPSIIPAISLTAHARDEDRRHAIKRGFQEHLAKPVNVAELLVTVRKLAGANPISSTGPRRCWARFRISLLRMPSSTTRQSWSYVTGTSLVRDRSDRLFTRSAAHPPDSHEAHGVAAGMSLR
jgi:hypothetical protein